MSVARSCASFSSFSSRSSLLCISLKLWASVPISSSDVQSTWWREPSRRVASMAAVRRISGRMTVIRLPMMAEAKTIADSDDQNGEDGEFVLAEARQQAGRRHADFHACRQTFAVLRVVDDFL